MSKETILARTVVELADTLVDDFDVVDLLTVLTDRCAWRWSGCPQPD